MKIKKITVKNFRSFGDYETSVDVVENMATLMIGNNGNGKSTIFVNAPLFALFGEVLGKVDNVVNRQTQKDCKVELEFVIDNDVYTIIRYRKHTQYGNKVVIFKNGTNISPLRADECQALINEIIGVSYNSMKSSVILSPAIYKPFLNETLADRLKIFEGILSLKIINQWADTAKKLREPILKAIEESTTKLNKAESAIESLTETNNSYKNKAKTELISLKTQKEAALKEINVLDKQLEEISVIDVKEEFEKAKVFEEVSKSNADIRNTIKSFSSKLTDQNSILKDLAEKKNKLARYLEVNVEEEIKRIEFAEEAKVNNLKINNFISQLNSTLVKTKSMTSKLEKLNYDIASIDSEISKMSGNVCYACGQATSDEIHSKLKSDKLNSKSKLEEEKSNLELEIKNTNDSNEIIKKQISEEEKKIIFIGLESNYGKKELNDMVSSIAVLKSEIPNLEKSALDADNTNTMFNEEIEKLNKQLKEENPSKYTLSYLLTLTSRIEQLNQNKKELENTISDIDIKAGSLFNKDFVDENEKKISVLSKGITKISKEIEEKELEDKYYETLLKLFSNKDGGIKKILVERMINIFNEKVADYLPIFFDSKTEVTFDKDLKEIIQIDDKEIDFAEFSSGEKKRFEVAISFALFSVVKQFFSSSVSFMVFDEVMDNALDKKGVDAVKSIITSFATTNSVIVISHKEEYKESFDNKIALIKDDKGYSRISN
jgi:DNA repair exonuclease SbcCD ATPase subunit